MNVDASAWEADTVVTSGYKWLGGHGGVALAVMSPLLLEHPPPLMGWMGAPEPFDFDAGSVRLADDARRYTLSTMSYASMASLAAALEQLLATGIDRIEKHASDLAAILVGGVSRFGWRPFRSLDDPGASAHIISLEHPQKSLESMAATLHNHRIQCGRRGGRMRVSIAPYNDESDIESVIRAIAQA